VILVTLVGQGGFDSASCSLRSDFAQPGRREHEATGEEFDARRQAAIAAINRSTSSPRPVEFLGKKSPADTDPQRHRLIHIRAIATRS